MPKKKKEEVLPPKVKQKVVRKDVKERKEANKDTEFTCVKMSFNSLVENNYLNGGIQEIVLNINKICFLSYQLLHLCTFKTPILLIHFLWIFTGFVLWDIFLFPIISTFYDVLIIPYWDAFYCMCYIFF